MNSNRRRPQVRVVAGGESLISSAGAALLLHAAEVSGLDAALGAQLAPWRARRAAHHPGKIVRDLAVALALGGDCLADLAVVRGQEQLFGPVASDPTVSRLVAALAADAPAALTALRAARAAARARVWALHPPVADSEPVIVDLDATLVVAHSEKEQAAPTWKRTFGFHPLLAFVDHGAGGTGECVGAMLRTGRATANNAADQIAVLTEALAQLPEGVADRVLVRADSAGGVHAVVDHLHRLGVRYSIGLAGFDQVLDALDRLPRQAWKAAVDTHGDRRDGAQVAELTQYLRATDTPWPAGMRVLARRERPHPGAQLRITDRDGWRITVFATNVLGGRLADHERTHRLRARAEDRIRCLKDTGLANLPLHDFAANQIWLEIVALANDLIAWTQHLAFTATPARVWEPKRLRLRLFNVAGRVVVTGRRYLLRLPRGWPWQATLIDGHRRLTALHA